jgi:hypothetical protein
MTFFWITIVFLFLILGFSNSKNTSDIKSAKGDIALTEMMFARRVYEVRIADFSAFLPVRILLFFVKT